MGRSTQAVIEFPKRRDPIGLLEEQARSRVPELVPIRYGTNARLAVRLLPGRRVDHGGGSRAHAGLGAARAAVRRRAPVELRGVRLAGAKPRLRHQRLRRDGARALGVGREAAGRELRDRGTRERLLRRRSGRAIVLATVRAYREAMRAFAGMRNLEVWYSSLPVEQAVREFTAGIDPKRLKKAEADIAKSRTKDSMHAFAKLTTTGGRRAAHHQRPAADRPDRRARPGRRGPRSDHERGSRHHPRPTGGRSRRDRRHLLERFRFVDLARKVVGVGSVGTRAWIALLLGDRRRRSAVPADQGGATVGARAVRGQERVLRTAASGWWPDSA